MILNVRLTGQHNRLGLEVSCRRRSLLNTGQTYKRKVDNIFSCSTTDGRKNDDCHKI